MPIVTELLDAYPLDEDVLEIKRDEELLLTKPEMKFAKLTDYKPLQVIHFPTEYVAQAFAPPRGVYESDHLRVEWQQMKGRQPFYHRNADVDELSYQVSGPRTTMTEYGTVEMRPGLFSRIPVGWHTIIMAERPSIYSSTSRLQCWRLCQCIRGANT